jgi:cobalt/nickel transport system permease protein
MHIPDNYLSPLTCAVMAIAVAPAWIVSSKKVAKDMPREKIPLLGIGAAFSFLIMMLNIPLPGGTTGHAVGGTLLAVLLGPWAACITISVALLIQALLFGDGGILAFGANCFNMAFVIPFLGYFVYAFVKERAKSRTGEYVGLALGSYLGINMAALCAAVEFGLQPLLFKDAAGLPLYCPYPLAVSIPSMLIPHLAVAGVAEAAFTLAIVAFIKRASPGAIYEGPPARTKPLYAIIVALICLSPLGLIATGGGWGERIADAPLSDYGVKGLPEAAGYILSAIAGAAALVILFKLLSLLKSGRRKKARA